MSDKEAKKPFTLFNNETGKSYEIPIIEESGSSVEVEEISNNNSFKKEVKQESPSQRPNPSSDSKKEISRPNTQKI